MPPVDWIVQARRILVGYLCKQGLDVNDADDLAQEVLLRLIRNWDRLGSPGIGQVIAWCFRVVCNLLADYYCRRRTVPLEGLPDLLFAVWPESEPPPDLVSLVARLPDEERRVFERTYLAPDSIVTDAVVGRDFYPERKGTGAAQHTRRVRLRAEEQLLRMLIKERYPLPRGLA